jgi:subtilisin family serine protease
VRETEALERSGGFQAAHRFETVVHGFSARLSDAQRTSVLAEDGVAAVMPDKRFQAQGMAPVAAKDTVPTGLRRIRAATATQVHDAAAGAVAVIDTGLDLRNPDLNAVSGVNCVSPGAQAQDDNGHGTHVGGTIAARNNGSGAVGVAPGTKLYAVKVLDKSAGGSLSGLLCGIDWVARNAAALDIRIANMSVAATGSDDGDCGRTNGDALHTAICTSIAAGVTFVASAGNSGSDLAANIPAAYREVITVTAMTDTDGLPGGKGKAKCSKTEIDDKAWTSSNYAATAADAAHVVAAPGACVVSSKLKGGTATMSGTSMAAPAVTGTVALCVGPAGAPGPCARLAPPQILTRIREDAAAAARDGWGFTGDPMAPIAGRGFGHLVSAARY